MILDNLPDILNMVIRRVENFLRTFEKNSLEKIAFWSISLYFTNPILRVSFQNHCFSKALRKFSMRRMTMFNISGRLSKIISLRSKRNQSHTTHQTDYMVGNVTKTAILKTHFQNRVGEVPRYASKRLFFYSKLFFKGS